MLSLNLLLTFLFQTTIYWFKTTISLSKVSLSKTIVSLSKTIVSLFNKYYLLFVKTAPSLFYTRRDLLIFLKIRLPLYIVIWSEMHNHNLFHLSLFWVPDSWAYPTWINATWEIYSPPSIFWKNAAHNYSLYSNLNWTSEIWLYPEAIQVGDYPKFYTSHRSGNLTPDPIVNFNPIVNPEPHTLNPAHAPDTSNRGFNIPITVYVMAGLAVYGIFDSLRLAI